VLSAKCAKDSSVVLEKEWSTAIVESQTIATEFTKVREDNRKIAKS
jgi:hypothetical protein